jgi:hypothetical protein
MTSHVPTCPLTRAQVAELYFIEHRAKVLDLAALLDRFDRARAGDGSRDFVVHALHAALAVLLDGKGDRARRVLELLSDDTAEPLESAQGLKGAYGAPAHRFQPAGVRAA